MGIFYPDDFMRFWQNYGAPKNSSKPKAYEAYKKAKDLPEPELLIQCVVSYNEFIRQNSKHNEYPKCHPATWLNQSRWEGFMDEAEIAVRRQNKLNEVKEASDQASGQTWPETVLAALRMSDEVLKAWIIPCTLVPGTPAQVVAPARFHANWLREKYLDRLERALGDGVKITYATPQPI